MKNGLFPFLTYYEGGFMQSVYWFFRRFIQFSVLRFFPWLKEEVIVSACGHVDARPMVDGKRRDENR